jgi:hypothetical protein
LLYVSGGIFGWALALKHSFEEEQVEGSLEQDDAVVVVSLGRRSTRVLASSGRNSTRSDGGIPT